MQTKLASRTMAFLSDVHGNLPALDAVLEDLRTRDVSDVFVAGDLLYGGEQPLEVWQRLTAIKARCTRGLSDTALATVDPKTLIPADPHEAQMASKFAHTRKQLGDLVAERLRRLPERIRVPLVDGRELLMVHGAPSDPSTDITHDMDEEEIRALVGDDPADIIVCGGNHVPFHRRYDDMEIVALGSVGSAPEGRVAHYTLIEPHLAGATVQQCHTTY